MQIGRESSKLFTLRCRLRSSGVEAGETPANPGASLLEMGTGSGDAGETPAIPGLGSSR